MSEDHPIRAGIATAIKKELLPGMLKAWQDEQVLRAIPFQGYSMRPLLCDRDLLYVQFQKFTEDNPIPPGVIALIFRNGALSAHRLIGQGKGGGGIFYQEVGDNAFNPTAAFPVDLLGTVVGFRRRNRIIWFERPPWPGLNRFICHVQRWFFSFRRHCPAVPGRDFLMKLVRLGVVFLAVQVVALQSRYLELLDV